MKKYYLKSNVVVEPLCWGWYAWSHLINPLTASMNIAYRHIPIMERFISKPDEYRSVTNQKFESGPIIQLEKTKYNKVNDLLNTTRQECRSLVELANSVKKVDNILAVSSNGGTLEGMYEQLPPSLKGLVELVYNINHQAYINFFETLIYQEYYDKSAQSILLYPVNSDWRPYILGTPRFADETNVALPCHFEAKSLDKLFASQFQGADIDELIKEMQIPQDQRNFFKNYFTTKPRRLGTDNNYNDEGVRVRYFGHACILLQTRNVNILVDPLVSYQYASDIDRYTFADLPSTIDYVVISHAHQDHFSIENLLKLRYKVKNILVPRNSKGSLADPSLKQILQNIGYSSVIEMDELDRLNIRDGQIIALPFLGEHAELDIQSKLAYVISLNNKKFCFAIDSNNFDNMVYTRIFKKLGPIDVLYIGMECDGGPINWLYGPLITRSYNAATTKTRTLSGSNYPKAYALAKESGCREAYVYAMGQEPWLDYIMNINYTETSPQIIESNKFIEKCRQENIIAERLYAKKEWHYKESI